MRDDKMIEELLMSKEGEHVQFKEAKNNFEADEAAKICCALSNCGGGRLVLGVTDRRPRRVVGSEAFKQPERTRSHIIGKLKVGVDFHEYVYEGMRVLIFEVDGHPLGLPVQCDGIAWWYNGDEFIPMPENVRRKIYDVSTYDFSGSICEAATIADLDRTAIEIFREKWREKTGDERYAVLSDEQLLMDSGVVTDDGITYAALILFGRHASIVRFLPQSEIVFEFRSSNASGPAAERQEFQEAFFLCYDRIWNLINSRNDRQHYHEGFHIFDVPAFNERACREAILNAASHRNYQMAGSIFVRQYEDRLVVESPGGFPSGITVDNILDKQSARNQCIARVLGLCGLVERSGQGMNIIYETCVREGKRLPDFTGTDDYSVTMTLSGLIADEDMPSVIRQIGDERLSVLSTNEYLTLNALYHREPLSENMKASLTRLTGLGIAEHTGRDTYALAQRLYVDAGKADLYERSVIRRRDSDMGLVLDHIRANDAAGTTIGELQRAFPNLTRNEIRAFIRGLQKEDRIYMVGKTAAARWHAR